MHCFSTRILGICKRPFKVRSNARSHGITDVWLVFYRMDFCFVYKREKIIATKGDYFFNTQGILYLTTHISALLPVSEFPWNTGAYKTRVFDTSNLLPLPTAIPVT